MKTLLLSGVIFVSACVWSPLVQPTEVPSAASGGRRTVEVNDFVTLVNRHRESVGCQPLIRDPRLAAVAQAHSTDMLDGNYYAHRNRQGQSPFDRLTAAGITYTRAAENISRGQSAARDVLRAWLASSAHRANIEECRYTRHGVGLAGTLWTHVFTGEGR